MTPRQWMWVYLISYAILATSQQIQPIYDDALIPANLLAPQFVVYRIPSLGRHPVSTNHSSLQAIRPRQDGNCSQCPRGQKFCGNSCWPDEYACCPGSSSACLPSEAYCYHGSCCENGATCVDAVSDECLPSEKKCGIYCIPRESTCCPDQQGGCSTGFYCDPNGFGGYGCCPDGKTCSGNCGDGGSDDGGSGDDGGTVDVSTFTISPSVQVPSTTVPQPITSTSEQQTAIPTSIGNDPLTTVLPTFATTQIPTFEPSIPTTSRTSTTTGLTATRSSSASVTTRSTTSATNAVSTFPATGMKLSMASVMRYLFVQIMFLVLIG